MTDQSQMLHEIEQQVDVTRHLIGRSTLSESVMRAMSEVPRVDFVPIEESRHAYDNGPLPISCGQTISQPYIVALMSDLLEVTGDAVVLEVGTGSGYQAAVLSRVVRQVYTVEIIETLSKSAKHRLQTLGYNNIACQCVDGYHGWPEHAPYDGIIVTAAAINIPAPLVEQLKPNGRLVIPVRRPYDSQRLVVVEKHHTGEISERSVLDVAFVPLTRSGGRLS